MDHDLQWKTTSNGRRPPMEDDLKILKVEYLSNHLLDHTQILNLSLNDHTTSEGLGASYSIVLHYHYGQEVGTRTSPAGGGTVTRSPTADSTSA